MAEVIDRIHWGLKRDKTSNRFYDVTWLVKSDGGEGPKSILAATGLPQPGDPWNFGGDNDEWAQCLWDAEVEMHDPGDMIGDYWTIKQQFTNKPHARNGSEESGNPTLEPYAISGSFNQVPREQIKDKEGALLLNSSKQQLRGPLVTRNVAEPTVSIGMNVEELPLGIIKDAINRVNETPMWGLDPRHIRLENSPWKRNIVGRDYVYYTITYEFLVRFESFDEEIIDRGTKVLMEGGDPTNPAHYEKARNVGEEGADEEIMLDGAGRPLADLENPVTTQPEIDKEFNFFILGIPADLLASP